MKRTTISLPDDLAAALEREARRRHLPVSQIAREAIEARLGRTPGKPKRYPFIGLVRGDPDNVAERFEEILAETWADDIERDRDP